MRAGGPEGLKALFDLGETPAAEDYGPALDWELPIWELYQMLSGQWRLSMAGPVALDLGVFVPVIQARGWDLDPALELLGAIERGALAEE